MRTASSYSADAYICKACKAAIRPRRPLRYWHATTTSIRRSSSSSQNKQASPLEGYYKLLLDEPLQQAAAAARVASPAEKRPATAKEERIAKARVIFGSRLAGPAERREELQRRSMNIAGVLVPPRPTEPDNCCMSGCVNCVWDRYRDELEDWAAKTAEARRRLLAQGGQMGIAPQTDAMAYPPASTHVSTSMDDDGGGSETNWEMSELRNPQNPDELFADIPVGIREFMRVEKLLRDKGIKEMQSRS